MFLRSTFICCAVAISFTHLNAGPVERNPVTGKGELRIVSERTEMKQGRALMPKHIQLHGGRYVCDPLVQEYVEEVGQKLVRVTKRKQLDFEFVVVNDSTPNAFTLPGGKILISRGLLEHLDNEAQLAAVLGHEIVHAAARHGAKRQERLGALAVVGQGVGLLTGGWGLLVGAATGAVAVPITEASYSRQNERDADLYGMQFMEAAGYHPNGMIEMQQKFLDLEKNKKIKTSKGWLASHPPTQERLDDVTHFAKSLKQNGTMGEAKYPLVMGRLKNSAEAYVVMKEGYKAFKEKDYKDGAHLAEQAIATCPNEPHFHALLGRCSQELGEHQKAVAEFDVAISQNPEYYKYYYFRGVSLQKIGEKELAKRDFKASYSLLTTPEAKKRLTRE